MLICAGSGSTSSIYNFQAQDGADYTWHSSTDAISFLIMFTRGSSGQLTELQRWVHISYRFLICLDLNPLSYSAVVTDLDIDVLVEG